MLLMLKLQLDLNVRVEKFDDKGKKLNRVAPKKLHHFCTPELYQILTDFHNCFTVKIRRKFTIKIPPHLQCEMPSVLKATVENRTKSEIKRHTLIVTKFFINKQNLTLKNNDKMPVTSMMTSLGTGTRISK